MSRRDQERTKLELRTIFDRLGFEAITRARFVARENLRVSKTAAQFARAADQIGVNMRLENVRDRNVFGARQLEIDLDIGSRIENRGGAFFVIADQIRNLGQPFRWDCFEDE